MTDVLGEPEAEHQAATEDSPGSRLQDRLRSLVAPLPEDSWKMPPPPIQEPLDPEATTTSAAGLGDVGDDGPSLFDPSGTGGSTGSTKAGRSLAEFRRGTARVYGVMIGALAGAVAGIANWRLKADDDDPTWLMLEEEADGIGRPLGRIAARRVALPVGDGETTDVMDGLEAGITVAAYVMRNLMQRSDRRRRPAAPGPMQDQAA